MTSKKLKSVLYKLEGMGLTVEECGLFMEAIKYCNERGIHQLDVQLTSDIYPHLARKKKMTPGTVEKKMVLSLKQCWESMDNRKRVVKLLKYEAKPTVKKLIQILLSV